MRPSFENTARRVFAMGAAAACVAGAMTAGIPAAAVAADSSSAESPYTVLFRNMESGRISPLTGSGGASVAAGCGQRLSLSHASCLVVSGASTAQSGASIPLASYMETGKKYEISAWARLSPGSGTASVRAAVVSGGVDTPVTEWTQVSGDGWVQFEGTYTATADVAGASLVFESDGAASYMLDDVLITGYSVPDITVTDPGPLLDTVDFPLGTAIEMRSTSGEPRELLTENFDQVSPENVMKPEEWYDATTHEFVTENAGADSLMDWAQDEGRRVYGHVLVWHSQVPDWWFTDSTGRALGNSEADKQALRDTITTHINNVAKYFSDRYGLFGSDTNPMVAWDVVNEVIDDSAATDRGGLRNSRFYQILGEEFIDVAFEAADKAFNETYAESGSNRPVKLFINEYGTEGGNNAGSKLQRYHALVERLLERNVPIDGVGHQFHTSMNSTNVNNLDVALSAFEDTGLQQAVTEFDVSTGSNGDQAQSEETLIAQGQWVKNAFAIFRAHTDDLFSVTVWGLYDMASWRYYEGAPLLFDNYFNPKWAAVGAAGGTLPATPEKATAASRTVAVRQAGFLDAAWKAGTSLPIGSATVIPVWNDAGLTMLVEGTEGDAVRVHQSGLSGGSLTCTIGESTCADGVGSAVWRVTDSGWKGIISVPMAGLSSGNTVKVNFGLVTASEEQLWSDALSSGRVTLGKELSFLAIPTASEAPVIDGVADDLWNDAPEVTTGLQVSGTDTAQGQVRTVWKDHTLYMIASVNDPDQDVSASAAHEKSSMEIFLDLGNQKNTSYTSTDTQLRINVNNEISWGSGRQPVVESAVTRTADGYVLEAAIDVGDTMTQGSLLGLDFQVNHAQAGHRIGVTNWADPTGNGWQNPSNWGVAELVGAALPDGTVAISGTPQVGEELTAQLAGWPEGTYVDYQWLVVDASAVSRIAPTEIEGATSATFTPTADLEGKSIAVRISAVQEDLQTERVVTSDAVGPVATATVAPTPTPTDGATTTPAGTQPTGTQPPTNGNLPNTGATVGYVALASLAFLGLGTLAVAAVRRKKVM